MGAFYYLFPTAYINIIYKHYKDYLPSNQHFLCHISKRRVWQEIQFMIGYISHKCCDLITLWFYCLGWTYISSKNLVVSLFMWKSVWITFQVLDFAANYSPVLTWFQYRKKLNNTYRTIIFLIEIGPKIRKFWKWLSFTKFHEAKNWLCQLVTQWCHCLTPFHSFCR